MVLVGEFLENLGDMSEEQGDQDIKVMEEHYRGWWGSNMMADYCWVLMRYIPEAVYQRYSKKTMFMQFTMNTVFLYRVYNEYSLFIPSFLIFTFNSSSLMCL